MTEDNVSEARDAEEVVDQRPHWATPLVRGWMIIAAATVVVLREILGNTSNIRSMSFRDLGIAGGIVVVVAIIQIVFGTFVWMTTRFRIDDNEICIEHRFITHESDRLSLSKIQGIDVIQPFAARIVGLARLSIDVGASDSKKLEFLKRRDAYELRDLLISRAHREATEHLTGDGIGSQWWDRRSDDQEIVSITASRALIAGFLSMTFVIQAALFIASIVLSIAADQPLGIAAILAVLVSIVGVVWKQLDTAWKFALLRSPGTLKAVHGLTSLTTRTVPVRRVQAIQVSQPLLWRPFGMSRVTMTVLGGASLSDVEQSEVLLPIGNDAQVRTALDALWPGFRLDAVPLHPIPRRARWFRWFDRKIIGWGFNEEVVVTRRGLFTRRHSVVPHARSQSVGLSQGPLQRTLGLADVDVHISPGPVRVSCPHLDAMDARAFAVAQMDRTRAARTRELSNQPPLDQPSPVTLVDHEQGAGN
ncbi:PH domain-containing protein [Cutibacterium sp. WCA-380-WT-3A]|uniref:PH domain-containing protein n=1 Tax=Cutibacterium porci TaxID=2605781 RepID=A0A7K0J935_9ACTN|nr:PH domain-containing protein [Cutibacterium porci]